MPMPVSEIVILMYGSLFLISSSSSNEMAPPFGVNLRALDSRLLIIFWILSESNQVSKGYSRPFTLNFIPRASELTLKTAKEFSITGTISALLTFSPRVEFSSLEISINWFTSESMRSMLPLTREIRLLCFPQREGSSDNWLTGPYIMVRGVRNSWEILEKNVMFILLIRFSCSISNSASRAALFSSIIRFLVRPIHHRMKRASTIYSMMKGIESRGWGFTRIFKEDSESTSSCPMQWRTLRV